MHPEARASRCRSDQVHHAFLAAASAQLGNATAAAAHASEVIHRSPTFNIETFLGTLHYLHASDTEHMRDGLKKAGLPAGEPMVQAAG